MENQWAGTLVQALSRNGWAMAMPMVLAQDQGVIGAGQAAHHAKDAHQHRANADREAEAIGVDDPGDRDGQRDEGHHERHRQQADLQIA